MKALTGLGMYQGQRLEPILKRKAVTLGEELPIDLPQDRVYKGLLVIQEWVATPTFAAATPKIHPRGITHAVSKKIEISLSAGNTIRAYRGIAQLQDQMKWMSGEEVPTLSKANSTTLNGGEVYGLPAFGATTQPLAVREAYAIPFENMISSNNQETRLNTAGINTAKLKINYGIASDIQDPSDTAVATFTLTGFITVYAYTSDHLIDKNDNDIWVQSYDEGQFVVQQNGSVTEFKPQGHLQGLFVRAFKGSKRKPLTNDELRNFQIKIEYNKNFLFDGNMADFQSLNGIKSSVEEFFNSAAYLNCLDSYTYGTGLDTVQAEGFKPLTFTLTTPSSIDHAAEPVFLVVEYDLIKVV